MHHDDDVYFANWLTGTVRTPRSRCAHGCGCCCRVQAYCVTIPRSRVPVGTEAVERDLAVTSPLPVVVAPMSVASTELCGDVMLAVHGTGGCDGVHVACPLNWCHR